MGKPRKKSWSSNGNEEEEDSLFANKFFFEGLLAQKGTPEARQHEEIANALWDLLEDVQLDARHAHLARCGAARSQAVHSANSETVSRHSARSYRGFYAFLA